MVTKIRNRFETIKQITLGEFSSVFLALDRETGSSVHIISLSNTSPNVASILDEIEQDIFKIQALSNEHILPIREFVRDGDRIYIISDFVGGETLEERLGHSAVEFEESLQIIRQVVDALEALHAAGIIHGDLKPSHILLTEGGKAYLSGFGIHKYASTLYADLPEVLVGPLGYMSPEQAQGLNSLDERSDLYSLGILFYRMLNGSLPFRAASPLSTAVQHAILPVPLLTQDLIPKKIKKTIQKAVRKEPAKRFGSVREFSNGLNYRKILVPRWVTWIIVLSLFVLGSIFAINTIPGILKNALREAFPQAYLILETSSAWSEITPKSSSTPIFIGQTPTSTPNPSSTQNQETQGATPTLLPAETATPRPTITSIYFQTSLAYSTTYPVQVNDTIFDIASKLQTDLSYLLGLNGLVCESRLYTGNELVIPAERILEYPLPEFKINSHNLDNLKLMHTLECMRDISDVRFSPDGSILAAASNHNIFMWRVSDWKPLFRIKGHNDKVTVIKFSPDGGQLASGSADNGVRIWSVEDGQLLQTIQQRDDITDLSYSANGKQLVVTSLSLSSMVYATDDWSQLHEFKGYKTNSAVFSPDSQILAISFNDRVDLFDTQNFSLIRSLPAEPSGGNLVFSPNGLLLATSNNVWQVADGLHIYQWDGPPHRVVVSVDMESLIVGPSVMKMRNGSTMREFKLPVERSARTAYAYDSVALSADEKMLAWGNQDGLFIYFGSNDPPYISSLDEAHYVGEDDNFFNIAAHYHVRLDALFRTNALTCQNLPYFDQSILIPGERETAVANLRLIQKSNFQNIERIKELDLSCSGEFGKLYFSADNNFLVNGAGIWNLETGSMMVQGETKARFGEEEGTLSPILASSAKISPDYQTAATVSGSFIQIWDLETGKLRHNLEGHAGRITTMVFSSDGKVLATSGLDENIFLWNVETARQLDGIFGFTAEDLIFTPDDGMLISVAGDTARFWSLEIGNNSQTAIFLEKQSGTPKTAFAGINGVYRLTTDGKYFSFVACEEWKGSHCIRQFVNSIRMDNLLEAHRYLGVKEIIQDFVFSPDGQLIAVASDNAIVLWSVEKEEKLFRLIGDTWAEERIQELSFTLDAKLLITQVNNRLLRVWDVASGEAIHAERINGLQTWAISPDQTMIAVIANNKFSLWGTNR